MTRCKKRKVIRDDKFFVKMGTKFVIFCVDWMFILELKTFQHNILMHRKVQQNLVDFHGAVATLIISLAITFHCNKYFLCNSLSLYALIETTITYCTTYNVNNSRDGKYNKYGYFKK